MSHERLISCGMKGIFLVAICLAASGCFSTPKTIYYTISPELIEQATEPTGTAVLAVEQFVGDAAYEDTRMVYRESDYVLAYYHYHRWTSPPGVMISDYLRVAYGRTGLFQSVESGFSPEAAAFLSGRILAVEEVDLSDDEWKARVVIDLKLRNSTTGRVVWTKIVTEEEPVDELNPAGVARAVSRAMQRIVVKAAPEIAAKAEAADRRQQQQEDQFLPTSPDEF